MTEQERYDMYLAIGGESTVELWELWWNVICHDVGSSRPHSVEIAIDISIYHTTNSTQTLRHGLEHEFRSRD